jgi:hypothetical protein
VCQATAFLFETISVLLSVEVSPCVEDSFALVGLTRIVDEDMAREG